MACGSILLKIAVSELVIIKFIHKFVEDFQIANNIQSLVEENWTDYATPGVCTPHCTFLMKQCTSLTSPGIGNVYSSLLA
jgi:hypothetical protein